MYEEFIIGYVLSGAALVLLAVVIVLQCIILKKISRSNIHHSEKTHYSLSKSNTYSESNRGTAICRNCATQFDAAHSVCPKCGTRR